MKTEESNKMIAEFMGNMHDGDVIHEELYDVSWDWLMPVVEKIEKNKYVDEFNINWDSLGEKHHCEITNTQKFTFETIRIYADSKIEAVYEAVVEFIKWYNKNKKL